MIYKLKVKLYNTTINELTIKLNNNNNNNNNNNKDFN